MCVNRLNVRVFADSRHNERIDAKMYIVDLVLARFFPCNSPFSYYLWSPHRYTVVVLLIFLILKIFNDFV